MLRHKLDALKLFISDEHLAELLAKVRRFATDNKRHLTDEDLKQLVAGFLKDHGLPDL
jgi:isopropylmalate/homocitrate/citramalate synthase